MSLAFISQTYARFVTALDARNIPTELISRLEESRFPYIESSGFESLAECFSNERERKALVFITLICMQI